MRWPIFFTPDHRLDNKIGLTTLDAASSLMELENHLILLLDL